MYLLIPLSNRFAWFPSCDIGLIPFCFLMEWLLDKTKMQLPITNSYLIILILFGSLMLNFWLFINGFVNLSFVLTTDIELPFMIFRFEGFLPLLWIWHILPQFSTSLPKFWLIVSSLWDSASAKISAIISFSCKALLSFDDLLEDELDDDFLLEECLEVTLLDLDDDCPFLSCSASLIQLWILLLNDTSFSYVPSN